MLQFTDGNSNKAESEVVGDNGSAVPSGTEVMEEVQTSTGSTGPEAVSAPPSTVMVQASVATQPPLDTQQMTPEETVCTQSRFVITYIDHRYRKLCKKAKKCFASGKYIPTDICALMNKIINWEDVTSTQFGKITYAMMQILDFFAAFSSDDSFETLEQVNV